MFFVLASVALSQPAAAASTPAVPQPQIEVVAPQQPRRICRMERDTSSHIQGRRICQTVAERDRERDENQREAERSANRTWERNWGDRPFNDFAQPGGGQARNSGSPQ